MAVKVKQRNGKWWIFIDHKGKRKAKCVGSKRAAEEVASQVAVRLGCKATTVPAKGCTPTWNNAGIIW